MFGHDYWNVYFFFCEVWHEILCLSTELSYYSVVKTSLCSLETSPMSEYVIITLCLRSLREAFRRAEVFRDAFQLRDCFLRWTAYGKKSFTPQGHEDFNLCFPLEVLKS